MLAVIAAVLGIVAAVLKLLNQKPDIMTWLIIIGLILVSVDVAMGWRGLGWYHRRVP